MGGVIIPGSSPISLIYALLCASGGAQCTLVDEEPFGGAWARQYNRTTGAVISKATHILMYSPGLADLLRELSFAPEPWQKPPEKFFYDTGKSETFGAGPELTFIGNAEKYTCLIDFLLNKVSSDDRVTIISGKVSYLSLNSTVYCELSSGRRIEGTGLVLTNGVDCRLRVNGKDIKKETTKFIVRTFHILVKTTPDIVDCFFHLDGIGAPIRELEIRILDNYSIILAKVSRSGSTMPQKRVVQFALNFIEHKFDTAVRVIEVSDDTYVNKRIYFDIDQEDYLGASIIIPGRIFSSNQSEEINVSQDLSRVFHDVDLIKNEIEAKLFNRCS